jgi:hypothetical protein
MAELSGVDGFNLKSDPAIVFSHPAVPQGPLYIHSGANAIKWAYKLNTVATPTIGGEVVQVLSAMVGPMQIQGQTAGLKTTKSKVLTKGEVRGWKSFDGKDNISPNHELESIVQWFRAYMEVAGSTTRGNQRRDERAVHFMYPARGWDFWIIPTSIDGFRYDATVISPQWSITAEIISDNALNFFAGVTMSSFNDDVLTNQSLIGKLGLSAFANSGTENDNSAFGQTGDAGSTDPFLNPELSPSAAEAAKKMGDNFQSLVAAWSSGTFQDFGFGALLDNGALPKNVDQVYQDLFGTSFLGRIPGASGPGTGNVSGSTVYGGPQNPTTKDDLVLDISAQFEAKGIPGKVGVAVSLVETGGSLNPDDRQAGGDFAMGLFQTFPNGAGGTYHKAQLTDAINNKDKPVTNYYPASLQIADASSWFAAALGNDSLNLASNEALAEFAHKAQGAGDPNYTAKVLAQLGNAASMISAAQAKNPVGGAASGVRLSVINWANKLLTYAQQTGQPTYSQSGRRDVENITPGDFSSLQPDDCSSCIAALYCWGTNNNHAFGLNGKSFNGTTTGTIWATWNSQVISPQAARAGDLIVWGSAPGEHVDMLMEDWTGDSTQLFGHGSGVPHVGDYAGNFSYFQGRGLSPFFFRVLP